MITTFRSASSRSICSKCAVKLDRRDFPPHRVSVPCDVRQESSLPHKIAHHAPWEQCVSSCSTRSLAFGSRGFACCAVRLAQVRLVLFSPPGCASSRRPSQRGSRLVPVDHCVLSNSDFFLMPWTTAPFSWTMSKPWALSSMFVILWNAPFSWMLIRSKAWRLSSLQRLRLSSLAVVVLHPSPRSSSEFRCHLQLVTWRLCFFRSVAEVHPTHRASSTFAQDPPFELQIQSFS